MKNLIQITILTIFCYRLFAQDIIVKNDKSEIKAKIEELTESSIKYKKTEMLDGPSYNINKRDVFMIIYKNGTKEYIESSQSQPAVAQSQSVEDSRSSTKFQNGNNNNMNTQNSNYNTSDLIVPKGGVYLYKEELISSWKEMNQIFVEHNAQESIDLLRKRKTMSMTGLGMGIGGTVTYLIIGRNNFGVGMLSLGVALGGTLLNLAATGQPKKAVAAYNNMIKSNKKISFIPTFNSDWQGNHLGISIGF